jgi:uncharacterized protein
MASIDHKMAELERWLCECESVLVAFSGGVDSTLVLRAAVEALDDRVLAVTGRSLSVPDWELEEAKELAATMGARHRILDTEELFDPRYAANSSDRCYFCKSELFTKLEPIRVAEELAVVIDGTNADDLGDHRPGMRARQEQGIRSPLVEVGLTKEEVREISRRFGLPTAEKPAFACLASRFPYGTPVTAGGLKKVAAAEDGVRRLGFRQFRVRHHGDVARLELGPSEIDRALDREIRAKLVQGLKAAGYRWVALDLEGYRTGSLNEILPGIGPDVDSPGGGC